MLKNCVKNWKRIDDNMAADVGQRERSKIKCYASAFSNIYILITTLFQKKNIWTCVKECTRWIIWCSQEPTIIRQRMMEAFLQVHSLTIKLAYFCLQKNQNSNTSGHFVHFIYKNHDSIIWSVWSAHTQMPSSFK